jgi:hypothetical protein
MKTFRRKLLVVRRITPVRQGFGTAVALIFLGAVALAVFESPFLSELPPSVLSNMGQIGATLLVAYAVETSWLVKQSRQRGSRNERWIGFVAGLGACGALGIAFAVALLGHPRGPFNAVEHWAAWWSVFSIGLLAGLVGALPYVLYEWAHALNTEYSDE